MKDNSCLRNVFFLFGLCRLNLDEWINEPESDSSEDETSGVGFFAAASEEHRYC